MQSKWLKLDEVNLGNFVDMQNEIPRHGYTREGHQNVLSRIENRVEEERNNRFENEGVKAFV